MGAEKLRKFLKDSAKISLYRAGYYHARTRLGQRENRLLILMYHNLAASDRIPSGGLIDEDTPTPSQLEAHLRELTVHHRVVALSEAVQEIRNGGLTEDSVAITFDDGNESVYTVAFPLLVKYGVPATLFVVPGWIEKSRVSWWQLLCEMVQRSALPSSAPAGTARVLGATAPPLPAASPNGFQARRQFVLGVEKLFREMQNEERLERLTLMQDVLFPEGNFIPMTSRVLSWGQIEEMSANRIDIESHTQSHIHIGTADLDLVDSEIFISKKAIERRTGRTVSGFAYPFGENLPAYRAMEPLLRKHGFAYACNACLGNNSSSSNLFSLFRCTLPLTTSSALINRDLRVLFHGESPGGHAPLPARREFAKAET